MIDKDDMLKKILDENKEELEKLKGGLKNDTPSFATVIIPMIRRIIPSVIASELVGVQPMMGMYEKYSVIKIEDVNGQNWYHMICNDEIWQWVIDTIDQAHYSDDTNEYQNRMILSEEATMMLKLKWS